MTLWLVVAVGFGVLLGVARAMESPLDDADPAYQRPGIIDLGPLPHPAPQLGENLPTPGKSMVAFFVRAEVAADLCRSLAESNFGDGADLAIVSSGDSDPACPDATFVTRETESLAAAYGLREPRSGGAPVGYVVVDSRGLIRYRTLDHEPARGLAEVATILRAVS